MKSMYSKPDLSVVRIYQRQEVIGAGFLVSNEYILTCAHVIATALEIDSDSPVKPTQEIKLDFPTVQPIQPLKATVEFWLPVNPGHPPEDIAVLKLMNSPPKEAQIAVLNRVIEQLPGNEFEAMGFPTGRSSGAWAEGVISRPVGDGWIQLFNPQVTGYRLEEGFSGTAIWDKTIGAVVGMAVAADKLRPDVKAAFMMPTELLLSAWDELSQICLVDSRISSLVTLLQPYFKDWQEQIEIAYQKSLPELSIRNIPDSIAKIVRSLDTRKDSSEDNYSCLEKFIGYFLLIIQDLDREEQLSNSLINWLDYPEEEYQDLINFLESSLKREKELNKNKEPCLLIGVFDDNNSLTVQGWLIEDIKRYKPIEELGCHSLAKEEEKLITDKELSNLPELVHGFYRRSLHYCQCTIQKIHFFLPYILVDQQAPSIDCLVIELNNPFSPSIGTKYEVVVRFSERLKPTEEEDQYSIIYKEKWQIVKDNLKQSVVQILHQSENINPRKLFKQLMSDDIVGVRITAPIPKVKLEFIMQAFYFAGIPIAVWLREGANKLNCCQELNSIYQESCLEELPRNIKDRRFQDWDEEPEAIGNHISLLWDDIELSPKRSLIMS